MSSIAYTTLDNDVYALFPTNLTEGMTLVFGGHSIRMTPATGMTMTTGGNVTKTTTSSLSDTDVTERLLYPNVFGPGTAVQYTPTLTGVKEEILLSYNVGKNSFDFLLETDGLVLTEINGLFVLIDPETEQQVGKLGEIIVFDSAGQIVRGQMTAQTIKDGQIYGVTVSVDQEFLASATYPVAIDPSFNINPFNQVDSNLIEDVSIYSDQNCEGYTFIEWHQIGTVIGGFYEGQAAFRFPAFYDQSILFDNYSTLTSDRIGSVTLHLKTTSNTSQSTMYVGQYTVDWPNTFKLFGDQYFDDDRSYNQDLFISNIPNNDSFSINITGFVKEWLDYNYGINDNPTLNPEQGILLYDLSYPGSVWIQSLEYDSSIYVTLDYSDTPGVTNVYMNNRASSTFLAADVPNNDVEMLSGLVSDVGSLITWTLVYRGEDRYTIHPNGQTDKYLNIFGEYDSEISQINTWYKGHVRGGVSWIVREELSNGTVDEYVLGVDEFGDLHIGESDDFNDDQRAWRVISVDTYNELETFQLSKSEIWIGKGESIDISDNIVIMCDDAYPHLASLNDFKMVSINTSVATVDDLVVTGASWGGVTSVNVIHIPTGRFVTCSLQAAPLGNNAYYIKSASANKYLVAGDSSIELKNNTDGNTIWHLEYISEGYYKIICAANEMTLSISPTNVASPKTGLTYLDFNDLDCQKWKIKVTSSGKYELIPKSGESCNFCAMVENGRVCQFIYSENTDYSDEWNIFEVNITNNLEQLPASDINTNLIYRFYKKDSFFALALEDWDITDENESLVVLDGDGDGRENESPTSNFLWRFEKEGDFYQILTMNTCGEPGSPEQNILISVDENGNVVTKEDAYPANNSSLWKIWQYDSYGTVLIQSELYPDMFLTRSSSGVVLTYYSGTASQWIIEEFEHNAFYPSTVRDYADFSPLDGAIIRCMLDESWDNEIVPDSYIAEAIEMWNGISENITLIYDPIPLSGYTYSVEFVLSPETGGYVGNGDVLGEMIAYDQNGFMANDDVTWHTMDIILYYNMFDDDYGAEMYISTLAHEIGHMLKLDHVSNSGEQMTYYSIMKASASDDKTTEYLTNYDKSALINKWGP